MTQTELDQRCADESRELAREFPDQSIIDTLDRLEAKDVAGELDGLNLPWHEDDHCIYDSDGQFVTQALCREPKLAAQVIRDHNLAFWAGALIQEIRHMNTYGKLEPREYELYKSALAAMESGR